MGQKKLSQPKMALRRIGAAFLTVIITFCSFPAVPVSSAALGQSGGYYYGTLDQHQQDLYRQLAAILTDPGHDQPLVPITLGASLTLGQLPGGTISYQQAASALSSRLDPALSALTADYPALFWLQKNPAVTPAGDPADFIEYDDSGGVLSIRSIYARVQYYQPAEESAAQLNELRSAADSLLRGVPSGSREGQVTWIHNRLLESTILTTEHSRHRDQSTGPLLYGKGSPAGLAKAFQLLCDQLEIPCVIVQGQGVSPVWNLVQMDNGQWYGVDIAYNMRQPDGQKTACLLVGEHTQTGASTFGQSHIPSGSLTPPVLAANAHEAALEPNGQFLVDRTLVYGDPLRTVTPSAENYFISRDGANRKVTGEIRWAEPNQILSVTDNIAAYRFLPDDSRYPEYHGAVAIPVVPREITVTPLPGQSREYSGSVYPANPLDWTIDTAQLVGDDQPPENLSGTLALSSKDVGQRLIQPGTLSWDNPNYTLRVTPHITCTVTPMQLKGGPLIVKDKAYDGNTSASIRGITLKTIVPGDDVRVSRQSAVFAQSDTGQGIAVRMERLELSGADAGNYLLPDMDSFYGEGNILPYRLPDTPVIHIPLNTEKPERTAIPIAERCLPDGLPSDDPSTRSFSGLTLLEGDGSLFKQAPCLDGDKLIYQAADTAKPGETARYSLAFSADNYEAGTVELLFETTEKSELLIFVEDHSGKTYDNQPVHFNVTCTDSAGKPIDNPPVLESLYTGIDNSYRSPNPPVDAGQYTLRVRVPESNTLYTGASNLCYFTIFPRDLYIRPNDKSIGEGASLPTLDYKLDGLAPGDDVSVLSPQPVLDCGAPTPSQPGTWVISVKNRPTAHNYHVFMSTGTLTVSAVQKEAGTLSFAAPEGQDGWYTKPITLTPSGDFYDKIGLSPEGPFSGQVTIQRETALATLELYLSKGSTVSEPIRFQYKLDLTPPQIGSFVYTQRKDQYRGHLAVQVSDALSGIDSIEVTGPSGNALTTDADGYPVETDGLYTVKAVDLAGNQSVQSQMVTIRRVEGIEITDSLGNPLGEGSAIPSALGVRVTGDAQPGDYTLTWASDKPEIIAVDPQGSLTMGGIGSATITASAMGKTASLVLESVLSTPVNQPEYGKPSAVIPEDSLPSGVSSGNLRLLVGAPPQSVRDNLLRKAADSRLNGMQVLTMDIRLVDISTGQEIQPAGEITIILPYGDDYDAGCSYAALHLHLDEMSFPPCSGQSDGIHLTVSGLSPFAIGYKRALTPEPGPIRPGGFGPAPEGTGNVGGGTYTPSDSTGSGSSGGSARRDDTPPETYWASILLQIREAPVGGSLSMDITGRGGVPAQVLQAAKERSVTLVIIDGATQVTLSGAAIPAPDTAKTHYTMADLAALRSAAGEFDAVAGPEPELETVVPLPSSSHAEASSAGVVSYAQVQRHEGFEEDAVKVEEVTPEVETAEIESDFMAFSLGEATDLDTYAAMEVTEQTDIGDAKPILTPTKPRSPLWVRLPLGVLAIALTIAFAWFMYRRLRY